MEKNGEVRAKKRTVDYTFSFLLWICSSGECKEYSIEPFGIAPSMLMMSFTTIFFFLCTPTCVLVSVWAIVYTIFFSPLPVFLLKKRKKEETEGSQTQLDTSIGFLLLIIPMMKRRRKRNEWKKNNTQPYYVRKKKRALLHIHIDMEIYIYFFRICCWFRKNENITLFYVHIDKKAAVTKSEKKKTIKTRRKARHKEILIFNLLFVSPNI